MGKLLIDPSLPEGPKFIGAPELAFSLHVKALCYCARALTDGFVPSGNARELVKKASSREFQRALNHLITVQPGCANPSWEERPGGWFLHDYDDPQYANPLRAESQQRARTRQIAGKSGGQRSADVRREKYGSAQPLRTPSAQSLSSAPEANAEASPEAPFDGVASSGAEASPKQTPRTTPKLPALHSTTTDVHGDHKNVSIRHGDNALQVPANGAVPDQPSPETQAVKLLDWLLVSRGSGSFRSRDEQEQEHAIAVQLVGLGLPLPELLATLQGYRDAADPDEVGSSLKFYWMRTQDDAHDVLKQQQRPHARTDGLTKAAESLPDIKHTKGSKP
jgi:hypothetical protein